MTTTGVHEQQAAEFLARHDRVMANLMKRTALSTCRGRPAATLPRSREYPAPAAGRGAARAIHGRFVALFDGDLSPEAVLAVPPESFEPRALGRKVARSEISRRKS